jgi:hypothetical protein
MPELDIVISAALSSLGPSADAAPDAGAISDRIAADVTAAMRALGLVAAGGTPVAVRVSTGDTGEVPFRVTAGETAIAGQAGALRPDARPAEIADIVTATICTQRSVLWAASGHTDSLAQCLVSLGAAVPAAPPEGDVARACEEALAARSKPVLSLAVSQDLAAATEDLPARLDALRGKFFGYWGVPIPVIPVETRPGLPAGRVRVTLLDTPYQVTVPADDGRAEGPAGGPAEFIVEAVGNITASNIASLLTVGGVNLLLGGLARTEPWLVSVLDARHDRIDITGILRVLLSDGFAIRGLPPVLQRLAGLTGSMPPDTPAIMVLSPACAYYAGDDGAPSYRAVARVIGPFASQYTHLLG